MKRYYFLILCMSFFLVLSGKAYSQAMLPIPAPETMPLVPSEHLLCLVKIDRKFYTCELGAPTGSPDIICECVVQNQIFQGYAIQRGIK